jgi:CRISPR-associated protein Cas6
MAYVELHFPLIGKSLATDHGYALFGAISRIVADAHAGDWLSISTLKGSGCGDGTMRLDQAAPLKIRLPVERVQELLNLAGTRLELNGHPIRLGPPQIHQLKPSPTLYARVVTIKGYTEAEPFLDAVERKLSELEVTVVASVGPRRIVRIGHRKIVGFAVVLQDLSDTSSILLQERGIGGRRHMGCGFFNPISRPPFERDSGSENA